MTEIHLTLRGEVGGKRAEVRLEPGQIRVQVLTVVAQQPALDATFPLGELTELCVKRRVQWTYIVIAIVIAFLLSNNAPPSIRELGMTAFLIYVLMLPVGLALVAWLLPRTSLRVATQDSFAEVDISTFSRSRAAQLIAAVRSMRPDIPV